MRPRWPTPERPWLSERRPGPYVGANRPLTWEAWIVLTAMLLGLLSLGLIAPWVGLVLCVPSMVVLLVAVLKQG